MALGRPFKGFTLIEMVIYFFLSSLALGIIVTMFTVAQRTQRQTYSQYLVGGSLSSTIRLLRREIQATALNTIQVYPEAGGAPGLSCVSAYDDDGKFSVNGFGVPNWKKHVFYSLNNDGSLTRWSKASTGPEFLPLPSTTLPSAVEGDAKSVMSGLLPPNKVVKDVIESNPFGGFEIGFVRRDNGEDTISRVNPAKSKDYATHTRLVQITLRTLEDRSEPDFSEITFRVCPRY